MSTEPVELTREALYELVWADPMRTVAKRLGISDVGLAKKCRRMNIPVPGLGYWAKKAAGKRVTQKRLPAMAPNDSAPRETTIYPTRTEEAPGPVAVQHAFESDPRNEIRVADHLRSPHPLVKATLVALDSSHLGRDHVTNRRADRLDVDVTPKLLRRALRIMDALIKALEARGWPVSLGSGDDRKTYVVIFDQRIPFGIRETLKKVENEPEKPRRLSTGEMYSPLYYSKYRDEHSGKLALVLRNSWGYGVSKSRVESASRPLEGRLNDFVLTLVWEANEGRERHERLKAEELRRREEAERRQAERDRLAAVEARRAAEAARHRVLEQQAAGWGRSRQIREYLGAVRAKLLEQPEVADERALAEWFEWAEAHACELDPLSRPVLELVQMCAAARSPVAGAAVIRDPDRGG